MIQKKMGMDKSVRRRTTTGQDLSEEKGRVRNGAEHSSVTGESNSLLVCVRGECWVHHACGSLNTPGKPSVM